MMKGDRAKAWETARQIERRSRGVFNAEHDLACMYGLIGDRDRAIAYLEKTYQTRSGSLILINVEPGLDPIRSDPRFIEIAERVGVVR